MKRILVIIFLMVLLTGALFVYTINKAEPTALHLFSPKDEGNDAAFAQKSDSLFTVILTDSNQVYFYTGEFNNNENVGKTGFKEIRDIISNKKKEFGANLVILIKPDGKATYKNAVDMLDEMAINEIKRYAMVDLTKEEAERLGLQVTQVSKK